MCGIDGAMVFVSSAVMSGTSGLRCWRGSLVLFLEKCVFAFATMGWPSGCSAGMAASFGTIMLYVLIPVCCWLLEWACQVFHPGVRAVWSCNGHEVIIHCHRGR